MFSLCFSSIIQFIKKTFRVRVLLQNTLTYTLILLKYRKQIENNPKIFFRKLLFCSFFTPLQPWEFQYSSSNNYFCFWNWNINIMHANGHLEHCGQTWAAGLENWTLSMSHSYIPLGNPKWWPCPCCPRRGHILLDLAGPQNVLGLLCESLPWNESKPRILCDRLWHLGDSASLCARGCSSPGCDFVNVTI